MVSQISEGLGGISGVIGILVAAVWVLALVVLIAVFAIISNERKKEFAVFRIMGASRKMLFRILGCEAVIISLIGAALGIIIAGILTAVLSGTLKEALAVPFLSPGIGMIVLLVVGAFAVSVCAGLLTALISARRITKSETGLLLREEG